MQNVPLSTVDATARPVLAIGTDYPPGTLLDSHRHRRAQLLYGMTGLMEVETDDGAWTVPPYSAVWIPAGQRHRVRMHGVSTRSLYIEPDRAPRTGRCCQVLSVSPLLHQLLLASAAVPALYQTDGRDGALMQLLLHEVGQAPTMPLFAPLPADRRLARLCKAFLRSPRVEVTPQSWAQTLHISPRSFSRLFLRHTGISFAEWRQRACLLAAMTRLSSGQSVTRVALELGYVNPSAFATMFRKRLGYAPSTLARQSAPATQR